MSTGIDRSIFVLGTVNVTNASAPTRWAWIMATAAGIRTIGASGGPFFPHAARATKDAKTIRREDHEETFRTAKITNNKVYFVTFETFVVSNVRGLGRRYSAAACSTGIG